MTHLQKIFLLSLSHMKNFRFTFFYILCICFFLGSKLVAQNKVDSQKAIAPVGLSDPQPAVEKSSVHLSVVDQKAELPPDFRAMLSSRLEYPKAAQDADISGKVLVEFIVEKDGSISNIKCISPKIGYGLEEEAIRVMKTMPKFKPAIKDGQPVRSLYRQPIRFQLQ